MRKADKLLLVLICLSMIFVAVNSVTSKIDQAGINLYSDSGSIQAETIAAEDTEDVRDNIFPVTLEFETESGSKVILEQFVNLLDIEHDMSIEIPVRDETLTFNISIGPEETWTYARVAGFVIIPEDTAVIDPIKTSYYPSSQELVVNLLSPTNRLYIYTDNKGAPGIVIPDVSASWKYNADNKLVEIKGKELVGETIIYWTGFLRVDGTMFVEDTRNIEVMENRIVKIRLKNAEMDSFIEVNQNLVDKLELEADSLDLEIEQIMAELEDMEIEISDINETTTEMESSITASVILSPALTIIWAIAFVIIIILLLDVLLKEKGAKP